MKNMHISNDRSSPPHIVTGKKGENLAAGWLEKQGFIIIEKNWRHKRFEVDIIASRRGVLHFIEVKTKTTLHGGFPEVHVTSEKIRRLVNASIPYRMLFPYWGRVQFDVLAITLQGNIMRNETNSGKVRQQQGISPVQPASGQIEYFFIEDVYT